MKEMPTFICVVKLVKTETFEKMSPKEEAIVSAHFERLEKALGEGNLILAGPSLDGEFGIIIFRAQSREQAEEFVKNDPAVNKGIMTAELHPFRVSLIENTR